MKHIIYIIGAGLFGLTCGRLLSNAGYDVVVYEMRDIAGGNIIDEKKDNIYIHKYGPHIFHTSDENIWEFVNRYSKFNNFINCPLAYSHGGLYNLPFNMNTFAKIFNIVKPEDAKNIINKEISEYNIKDPHNLKSKHYH